MRCLACSSELQDSAKFCGQCGATIGRDLENNVSKVAQDISKPDSNGLSNGVEKLENVPTPTTKSKEVRSSEKILESEPFWQSMKPFYYGALLALFLALVGALYSYLPSISATLTRVSTTTNMVKNIIMGVKEEKIIYEFNSYYKNERSLADWVLVPVLYKFINASFLSPRPKVNFRNVLAFSTNSLKHSSKLLSSSFLIGILRDLYELVKLHSRIFSLSVS